MNEEEKQAYKEKYRQAKEKGVPFFPDVIFKDSVAALIVFLILVALAFFIGAPLEERADPADSNYTPRPEWYFLFLFQLLKYFPGELEIIGVVVIPTLAILILFILPLVDRGPRRYFTSRPLIIAVTTLMAVGVIFLTAQSILETPPPFEASTGDQTAALYSENCAGCHGQEIIVPSGTNLHEVITQGKHEGMPAWTADLTTDEVDALAGFILSPAGNELFNQHCSSCHQAPDLVAGDPVELRKVFDEGQSYVPHSEEEVPEWSEILVREERTALLNFLLAPDGQRLFATNCSACHGRSVAFSEEDGDLHDIISEGGMHLEMPSWQERLSDSELDRLALYVVKPSASGEALFTQYCLRCHGDLLPATDNYSETREIIASGGSHQTMPVWGDVLTSEQLEALVNYTLAAASGEPLTAGQQLYADQCTSCHGDFGEGGENPARPNDVIAPISTSEYLKTRDDATIRAVIAQGQPNFGMSPFGSAFGGPLDEEDIDSLVAYIRSWEAAPPVEFPPEIFAGTVALTGLEIYLDVCAQCHGLDGRGVTAPSLRDAGFRSSNTDQDIYDTIDLGHETSSMISWGAILSSEQIQDLVDYILTFPVEEAEPEPEPEIDDGTDEGTEVTDESDTEVETETQSESQSETDETEEQSTFTFGVFPILEARCIDCHGTDGGWDASTYELIMTTGDNGPVVIPGDVEGSLLAQKLIGTHADGDIMPPPPLRVLSEELIQIILDWIAAGALEK